MSLQFVIDGYNIINHALFVSATGKKTRSSLFTLLDIIKTKRLCGSARNKITVVFDGFINEPQLGQYRNEIRVIFSYDETADDKIKQIIEQTKNKKNIVVVSDDREIADFVKISGAVSMGVIRFLDKISKQKINDRRDTTGQGQDKIEDKSLNYSQINIINEELKKKWIL